MEKERKKKETLYNNKTRKRKTKTFYKEVNKKNFSPSDDLTGSRHEKPLKYTFPTIFI